MHSRDSDEAKTCRSHSPPCLSLHVNQCHCGTPWAMGIQRRIQYIMNRVLVPTHMEVFQAAVA